MKESETKRLVRIRQDLEIQVIDWLDSQSDSVRYFVPRNQGTPETLDADILVLQPFPCAIELWVSNPRSLAMRMKRFLNQRINLADRFSPYLPLIVITPDLDGADAIPLADATFRVSDLPMLEDLSGSLKLNKEVHQLIIKGNPGDVEFSDPEQLDILISNSVPVGILGHSESEFPDGSLAELFQQNLQVSRKGKKQTPLENTGLSGRGGKSPSIPLDFIEAGDFNPSDWYSKEGSKIMEATINQFVKGNCGGSVVNKRYKGIGGQGTLSRTLWKANNGKNVVIRRQAFSMETLNHRVQELVAEAWMTRALATDKIDEQILLLGFFVDDLPPWVFKESGFDGYRSTGMKIQQYNTLEGAGWKVFPWDFEETEPEFIKFLNQIGHD